MAVILDTDHFSLLQNREATESSVLRARLAQLQVHEVQVTIVSFQEQAQGWLAWIHRARKPDEVLRRFSYLQGLLTHYAKLDVLPFDQAALSEFNNLRRLRVRIGTSDLRIAAIAKVHGVKVLTRNLRDFRQVPAMDVEDWTV